MEIFLALLLGGIFGFVLQRVGAADPDRILGMLRLTDLHLVKVILFAIGFSSLLLFVSLTIGLVDSGNLGVKGLYPGVIVGGMLLGAGWAISGFCPGTGVAAAGSGRRDAMVFVVGGLLGAGLFTLIYGSFDDSALMAPFFGGKISLVRAGEATALVDAGWSFVLAVALGVVMMIAARALPSHLR